MDGVFVSNHGGRQVDGSIASLDVLPSIVEVVDGRAPVIVEAGVREVIANIAADFELTMALGLPLHFADPTRDNSRSALARLSH